MSPSRFVHEHQQELRLFIKHVGPYIVAFWGVIGALVAAGWLDLPARSQDVVQLKEEIARFRTGQQVRDLKTVDNMLQLQNSLRELELRDSAKNEQLRGIEESGKRVESKLDRLIERLSNAR